MLCVVEERQANMAHVKRKERYILERINPRSANTLASICLHRARAFRVAVSPLTNPSPCAPRVKLAGSSIDYCFELVNLLTNAGCKTVHLLIGRAGCLEGVANLIVGELANDACKPFGVLNRDRFEPAAHLA